MPAKKVYTIERNGEQIAVFGRQEDRDICIEALEEDQEGEEGEPSELTAGTERYAENDEDE
jgi:hypothetical protein